MRILLTADPFVPVPPEHYGGIERIVAGLISQFRDRGHQIGLLAHPASKAPVDYFLPWSHTDPRGLAAHSRNMLCLRRACHQFQPELIHSFSRILYLAGLLISKTPKLMSYQRPVASRSVRLASLLAGRSMAFTGCSQFIASMGRASGGRWHAIPNFVDTSSYDFSVVVRPDAPLVFLSRVESIKGAHLAIEVAKTTGRRLIIAGNYATSGPERDYWDKIIRPQIGSNGIEYAGPVNDAAKGKLLNSALAMIVPIQWDEPFGIVFAEALACGTPVISCPRGALPEIVREGVDGFLVRNVEQACEAVQLLTLIDRHGCRKRAESTFSASVVSRQYEVLYQEVIAQAG